MKSICIHRPKNPIDFLIQKLEEPERTPILYAERRIFIVGPPGFELQKLALAIADSYHESSGLQ